LQHETNICYIAKGQIIYLNISRNIVIRVSPFTMIFQHEERKLILITLKMLNLEITDNLKHRKWLITSIYWLSRTIENNLPRHICKKFFNTQQRSLNKLFIHEENRLLKKLNWLLTTKNTNNNKVNNIKKLKYFCSNEATNSTNDLKISFDGQHHSSNATHTIELDSNNYNFKEKSLLEPRKG